MKTCIYLRKSRADRDNPNLPDSEVLKRHKDTLIAYAKVNHLDVIEIKEEVVSGEKLSLRPQMIKLLEEIEDNKYDAVLVMDFDRLGRGSMMEQGLIINAFKESNTKIITPNKTYDLDDDFDEDYLDLSALFARKELKMITKRLHRGRMKSLEEGNYISPWAPYGYDKENKTLVINSAEADIIKLIFDLYVNQGYGDTRIARYLQDQNINNKNGGSKWDRTTIRKIIQNPVYIGKVTWNKREYRYKDDGKRTSKFLDKSEWKVYDAKHEAIIDEETFKKAQILSKERYQPHVHEKKKLRNPLAYLIKCGNCGATMTIRTAAGKMDSLRCYKACGVTSSSYIHLVEKEVVKLVIQHLNEIEYKFKYQEKPYDIVEKEVLLKALKDNQAELEKVYMQKEKLYDLLEQGLYDNKTFLERMNRVTSRIDLINKSIDTQEEQLGNIDSQMNDYIHRLPKVRDMKDFFEDIYWTLDVEEKNKSLREVVDNAVYYKTAKYQDFKLEVTLKL